MNRFSLFGQLPPLSEFLKKKTQHLVERLYNLRVDDVLTEARYQQTRDFIREAVLPSPVSFGEPIFSHSLSLAAPPIIARVESKLRSVVVRQIMLPFSGCRELFAFAPDKSLHLPYEAAILQPEDGYLTVKLHTIFFSRYDALQAARYILNATLQMISVNNEELKSWTSTAEDRISRKMLEFRQSCVDLYSANGSLSINKG